MGAWVLLIDYQSQLIKSINQESPLPQSQPKAQETDCTLRCSRIFNIKEGGYQEEEEESIVIQLPKMCRDQIK
jgi:hypothetical protein